jgi:hypothetical protein
MVCRFIFPSGKRCRCSATPSHVFCQHHAPQPPVPGRHSRPLPAAAGSSFRNWRDLERNIITLEPGEIPAEALFILCALLSDGPSGISDVNAGRLLRALLRRLGTVPFSVNGDPEPPVPGYPVDPEAFERFIAILERHAPNIPDDPAEASMKAWEKAIPLPPELQLTEELPPVWPAAGLTSVTPTLTPIPPIKLSQRPTPGGGFNSAQ